MGQMHIPGARTYPGSDTGSALSFLHSTEGLVKRAVNLVNEAPASGAAKRWENLTPANQPPVPHLLGRSSSAPGDYYPFIHGLVGVGSSTTVVVVAANAHLLGLCVGDEFNVYDVDGATWLTAQTISAISADGLTVTVDTALSATPAENDVWAYYPNAGVKDPTHMVVLMEPYSTDITADGDCTVQVAYAGHFLRDAFPTFCTNTTIWDETLMARLSFYTRQV